MKRWIQWDCIIDVLKKKSKQFIYTITHPLTHHGHRGVDEQWTCWLNLVWLWASTWITSKPFFVQLQMLLAHFCLHRLLLPCTLPCRMVFASPKSIVPKPSLIWVSSFLLWSVGIYHAAFVEWCFCKLQCWWYCFCIRCQGVFWVIQFYCLNPSF